MNVFVDTNILLDVLIKRDPFHEAASGIWALAESGRIAAYVSAMSLPNCYYFVRKLAGVNKAKESILLIRSAFGIIGLDTEVIDQATLLNLNDYEDALQYASALKCQPAYLITRNTRHFPKDQINIVTADEFFEAVTKS